jgi:hypothetical protein
MTTISLTVGPATPCASTLRRIALSTGVALVRWAHRGPAATVPTSALTHEQQSLRLAAQADIQRQRDSLRYGIAQ